MIRLAPSVRGIKKAVAFGLIWGFCGVALAFPDDVLRATTALSVLNDSNLFKLPAGASLQGVDHRSDLSTTLTGLLEFDRVISQQTIDLTASINDTRFAHYDRLNSVAYALQGTWGWRLADQSNLSFSLSTDRTTIGFADLRSVQLAQVNTVAYGVRGQYEFVPRWSWIGSLGGTHARNSLEVRRPLDYTQNYFETGLRFDWRTGSAFDFVFRRDSTHYPNLQVRDSLGNPLSVFVDNAFTQSELATKMSWQATEASRLTGRIALSSRHHENLSQRDFNGLNFNLTGTWQPRAKTSVTAVLRNELSPISDIAANYVVLRGLSTDANWAVTDKVNLSAGFDWLQRDFKGDPGFLLTSSERRHDRIEGVSVGVSAVPKHFLRLSAELRFDRRRSNYATFNFDATTFFVRGAFTF